MRRKARGAKRGEQKSSEDEPPEKLVKADSGNTALRMAIAQVKDRSSGEIRIHKPHPTAAGVLKKEVTVYMDYTCMLNQTNIGQNNNKYYVIQVLQNEGIFTVFTHWGRVGEQGQHAFCDFSSDDPAVEYFMKKFKDKTGNDWKKRDSFTPRPKKYTLLEMDSFDAPDSVDRLETQRDLRGEEETDDVGSKLDEETQLLIKLIFDKAMFEQEMMNMNLDIKKMPLGQLSKLQIARGLEALIDIEEAIKAKKTAATLQELSSKFYTLIPHNFGRCLPPNIDSLDVVRQKMDVLLTISDIELAQSLQNKKKKSKLNPIDENYQSLCCKLELLDEDADDYEWIKQFTNASASTAWPGRELKDVWIIDRDGEKDRFSCHDQLKNRKLLWHGTRVAVVAAILNSGLRIMPHSGGLVGKGIYMASEHSKSAGYARPLYGKPNGKTNVSLMFIVEAALGKEKHITNFDNTLTRPPPGYDSIVGRGRTEPDPKKDKKVHIEGRQVTVPLGPPIPQKQYKDSSFWQSEYLIYQESQARLRYLLRFNYE